MWFINCTVDCKGKQTTTIKVNKFFSQLNEIQN